MCDSQDFAQSKKGGSNEAINAAASKPGQLKESGPVSKGSAHWGLTMRSRLEWPSTVLPLH